MGSFLKALSKVGLVELDGSEAEAPSGEMSPEEIRALLDENKGAEGKTSAPAEPPPPPPPPPSTEVTEGRPFEELYGEHGVQPSPFPAEKLIKLLDGLRAMDENTRKQAILAMDSADEAWTIDDAVLDASRKTEALRRAQAQINSTVEALAANAEQELSAQDKYQTEATQTIRDQIAELEETLQKEVAAVAESKAKIKSQLDANRGAAQRENARLELEVTRLSEIPRIFKTQGS